MSAVKKPVKRKSKKKVVTESTPLLASERRFCDEYFKDLNIMHSAIRAGYSPRSAANIGTMLRKKPNVAAHIMRMTSERSIRTGTEVDRILREAARIAFSQPTSFVNADGSINTDLSEDDAAAVAGIKVKTVSFGEEGGSVEREVKIWDKNKALDLLMKYGRVSAEFERKMEIEREKLKQRDREIAIEERRLAIQEAAVEKEKAGANTILNILDPFGDRIPEVEHADG